MFAFIGGRQLVKMKAACLCVFPLFSPIKDRRSGVLSCSRLILSLRFSPYPLHFTQEAGCFSIVTAVHRNPAYLVTELQGRDFVPEPELVVSAKALLYELAVAELCDAFALRALDLEGARQQHLQGDRVVDGHETRAIHRVHAF